MPPNEYTACEAESTILPGPCNDEVVSGDKPRPSASRIGRWKINEPGQAYVLVARLVEEKEGGYSAYAARLPGVVSQGETIPEGMRNIEEAFRAAIQSYREHDETIPWQAELAPKEPGEIERWVVVDVR